MSIKRVSQLSFNPGPPVQDVLNKVTIGTAVDVGIGRAFSNGAADVSFTRATTGGIPDSYTVTSTPGNVSVTGTTSPIRVAGLTGGTSYTFTVVGNKTGGASSPVSNATPSTLITTIPGTPVVGLIQNQDGRDYDDGYIALSVSAPSGGSNIQYFTVVATPDPSIVPALPTVTLTGLSPIPLNPLKGNVNYTFTVTATNANGTSPATTYSTSIKTYTTPQTPVLDSVTAGSNSQLTIAFHPNRDGGASIASYLITYSADATFNPANILTKSVYSSPAVITGVKPRTYVKVQAVNSYGRSQYSNTISQAVS